MFVDIEDFKSAIGVENILTPYRKGRVAPDKKSRLPKEHITPDVCAQILKSTNNPVNIKHMLECIKELPALEQAQFKDVILSTFEQREQPHDILVLAKKLALANGFEKELGEAQKLNEGKFLVSDSRLSYGLKLQEIPVLGGKFDGIDKLICSSDKEVTILLPNTDLPPILDIPNSPYVMLMCANLADIKQIKLKEGAEINLSHTDVFPDSLDLSMCSKVTVDTADKNELEKLNCPEGKWAFFAASENYDDTSSLDLTPFDEVTFSFCSYEGQPDIRFKDGAKFSVEFTTALNGELPEWDYTQFSVLELNTCQLKQGTLLKFRKGADVTLNNVHNLPEKIDFSDCGKVVLETCDFSTVKQLVFKNREQFAQSSIDYYLNKDWRGELIFADENNQQPLKFNGDLLDAIYQIKHTR